MSRETIPAAVRAVLDEILEELQSAESAAFDNAREKSESDRSFAYVAGYIGAVVDQQAKRLSRLLDDYAQPEAPKKGGAA